MNGAIFKETLKRNWRQMLYWGIGAGILGLYVVIIIPNMDTLQEYQRLIDTMPPIVMQAMGAANTSTVFATPEGYVSFSFLTYGFLLFVVYGVLAGLNITANEEDDGILDMLLALPLSRTRMVAEKFAAYTLLTIGIVALSFSGLAIGAAMSTLPFDMSKLLPGALPMTVGIVMVMAFTAFVSVLVRRKTTAIGVVTAFIIISYFVNFIGNAASDSPVGALGAFSFFRYADAQNIVSEGLNVAGVVLLAGFTVVLFGASIWLFERRDVGV